MNSDKKSKEIEYMYEDIMKDLHDGVVRVTFTKKDGSERKMKCTLNENMLPQFETVKTSQAKDVNKQVIKCWEKGVAQLVKGQKAKLNCPPDVAYGRSGAGGVIPPNATIQFDVEVIGW